MVKTRPVLVGGLGLVAGLGLLEAVTHGGPETFGIGGLIALAAGAWWLRSRSPALELAAPPPRLTRAMVEAQIDRAAVTLTYLEQELTNQSIATQQAILPPLQQRLATLRSDLDQRSLRIAIVGGQAVGKSALAQAIAESWPGLSDRAIQLIDTATLFGTANVPAKADSLAWSISQAALDADWLLFVAAGDLTALDLDCLTWLKPRTTRLLVLLNKLDHYNPDAQAALLAQVQLRLRDLLPIESVIPIAAAPAAIRLTPVDPAESTGSIPISISNGSAIVPHSRNPVIGTLTRSLLQSLAGPIDLLPWDTTIHSADRLQDYAKTLLNQLRQRQAIVVIDQYQWIAGGAAFINPVPSLDLLATLAVNSQMILDLGKLHRQSFSLDQAKTVAGALAEMVVKLGFVELSTQALTTILKTNHVTYVAGGVVQGVSAAHLTRMVGLSLTDYFQSLDPMVQNQPIALDQLRQSVQKIFTANQQAPLLQGFAQQALKNLKIPMRQPIRQALQPVQAQPVKTPDAIETSLKSSQIL